MFLIFSVHLILNLYSASILSLSFLNKSHIFLSLSLISLCPISGKVRMCLSKVYVSLPFYGYLCLYVSLPSPLSQCFFFDLFKNLDWSSDWQHSFQIYAFISASNHPYYYGNPYFPSFLSLQNFLSLGHRYSVLLANP